MYCDARVCHRYIQIRYLLPADVYNDVQGQYFCNIKSIKHVTHALAVACSGIDSLSHEFNIYAGTL